VRLCGDKKLKSTSAKPGDHIKNAETFLPPTTTIVINTLPALTQSGMSANAGLTAACAQTVKPGTPD
jgi:hypothetical protein